MLVFQGRIIKLEDGKEAQKVNEEVTAGKVQYWTQQLP
jgi:hypothetical protein